VLSVITMTQHTVPGTTDRFPAPTAGGSQGSTLVLSIGPFRDWLDEYMRAHELTSADVARSIGRDETMVRGWFGVRGRHWRTQSPDRFVAHVISELAIEHVGLALTGNPRLVPELYPQWPSPSANAAAHPPTATTSATNTARSPPDNTSDRHHRPRARPPFSRSLHLRPSQSSTTPATRTRSDATS
jgi:hypothetical protein